MNLRTTSSQIKPDHESQVRPLIGLSPEEANLAWAHAVEKAAGKRITARMVKNAMLVLNLAPPDEKAALIPHQTKTELRRLIDAGVGELLALLAQKVSHDQLTGKVETLYRNVQGLFPKAKRVALLSRDAHQQAS